MINPDENYYLQVIVEESSVNVNILNIRGVMYQHAATLGVLLQGLLEAYKYRPINRELPFSIAHTLNDALKHNQHFVGIHGYYLDNLVVDMGEATRVINEYNRHKDLAIEKYTAEAESERKADLDEWFKSPVYQKYFGTEKEARAYLDGAMSMSDCVDNQRFAYQANEEQMKRYKEQKERGCCGFVDWCISINGEIAFMGYNYGH